MILGKKIFLSLACVFALMAPISVFAQDQGAAAPDSSTAGTSTQTQKQSGSAAEGIDVKLQVPLPFVKTKNGVVDNLSDYIEGIYRLGIGLAGTFAVIMIIIAGYQWMTSGGSSDKTGAAKKRIFNAGIGLMLALLAYIILNAITPRLVALRLPKVDPVRSISLDINDTRCDSPRMLATLLGKKSTKFTDQQTSEWLANADAEFVAQSTAKQPAGSPLPEPVSLTETACNNWYSIFKQNDLEKVVGQCQGYACTTKGETCSISGCRSYYLEGEISWDGVLDGRDVDNLDLYPVCHGRLYGKLSQHLDTSGTRFYRFTKQEVSPNPGAHYASLYDAAIEVCGLQTDKEKNIAAGKKPLTGLNGFVMKVEVNDGLGNEDNVYAVGRNCVTPLVNDGAAPDGTPLTFQQKFEFSRIDFSKDAIQVGLFRFNDLQQGYTCNLTISNNFKDYD